MGLKQPKRFRVITMKLKLAKETYILIAIGIADLISTIFFIQRHGASEANPIFRHYWDMGLPIFITAKIALMACPLLILEWARRTKPRLVARGLRCAIAGYVILYGVGVARLNIQSARASAAQRNELDGYPPTSQAEVDRLLKRFHRLGKNMPPTPILTVEDVEAAE